MPAKTANTSITCNPALYPACENYKGVVYPGWDQPIGTFTGRWFDSILQRENQSGFRTAHGFGVRVSPKRVYWMSTGTIVAYDIDRFFSRLSTGVGESQLISALAFSSFVPGTMRQGSVTDVLLQWDAFFNPEGSSWTTPLIDGQRRMWDFDWDDRGYVYMACGEFGWGVVKDDYAIGANQMTSAFQQLDNSISPKTIISIAANGQYYALVGGSESTKMQVWNIGDRNNIARTRQQDLNFTIHSYAKSADGTRIAITRTDGGFGIYTTSSIAGGGHPQPILTVPSSDGVFVGVTTDGTNFFGSLSASTPQITVVAADGGGGYSVRPSIPVSLAGNMQYASGVIAITGSDPAALRANTKLFTVSNLAVREMATATGTPFRYLADFYGAAGSQIYEAAPYTYQGKSYLLMSTYTLGDVYELASAANSINVKLTPTAPVYGDAVKFTTTSSQPVKPVVNFSFGDGTSTQILPRALTPPDYDDFTHTYGGQTSTTLPKTITAVATSAADSSISTNVTVPLNAPAKVGFAITGRPDLLFTQPNASSTAAIVSGDSFFDVSDGTAAGHYSDWTITTAGGAPVLSQSAAPSTPIPAGDCGTYNLTFRAHYGPNASAFAIPAGSDASYYLGGTSPSSLGYTVAPFALEIKKDPTDATGLRMLASARVSSRAADVTAGSTTACTYHWSLLGQGNGQAALQESSGACTLGAIPAFAVLQSNMVGSSMSVNLTLTVATAAIATSCAGRESATVSTAFSATPTCPAIGTNDFYAVYAGGQCSAYQPGVSCTAGELLRFTARPSPGTATICTPYTVAWDFGDGITFTTTDLYADNVTHTYASGGSFAASVTIRDASNHSLRIPMTVPVGGVVQPQPTPQPSCGAAPSSLGLEIVFSGSASGCTSSFGSCTSQDIITFSVTPSNVLSCTPYTFTWNFGDGGTATSSTFNGSASHQFAGSSLPYSVTVNVRDGNGQQGNFTRTVPVGGSSTSCTPPTPQNLEITFGGSASGCTSSFGTCTAADQITFNVAPKNGYALSCTPYTFSWSFGDGQFASSQAATHQFAGSAQPYTVALNVTDRTGQTATLTRALTVSGGTASCTPPSVNNMEIVFSGSVSGCTSSAGTCSDKDVITFSLAPKNGFAFSCTPYSFSWNFDGILAAGSADNRGQIAHTFVSGSHSISVQVTDNNNQTATITRPQMNISGIFGGGPPPCSPTSLCLNSNGRYEVTLTAKDSSGKPVTGASVAQSGPFGFFSFPTLTGDATNPEVLVKVLEPAAGKPWVFYAGLTNLDYTLNVQDKNGTFKKSYHVDAPPSGSFQSYGDFDVDGNKSPTCLPVLIDKSVMVPAPTCTSDSTSLCLLDRFKVTLEARDNPSRSNKVGTGLTIPVNKVFGFFSVPGISLDPANIETFIKMVDATKFNGHFWVFLGGLTDMQLSISVTDSVTGARNIYTKPVSSTCGWNDVNAF